MLRPIRIPDLDRIVEIHKKNQDTDLDFTSMLYEAVYEKNGNVLAYASMRRINELTMILDKDLSTRDRAIILSEYMRLTKHVVSKDQVGKILTFTDEHFANILTKHFGFIREKLTPLILVTGD